MKLLALVSLWSLITAVGVLLLRQAAPVRRLAFRVRASQAACVEALSALCTDTHAQYQEEWVVGRVRPEAIHLGLWTRGRKRSLVDLDARIRGENGVTSLFGECRVQFAT